MTEYREIKIELDLRVEKVEILNVFDEKQTFGCRHSKILFFCRKLRFGYLNRLFLNHSDFRSSYRSTKEDIFKRQKDEISN